MKTVENLKVMLDKDIEDFYIKLKARVIQLTEIAGGKIEKAVILEELITAPSLEIPKAIQDDYFKMYKFVEFLQGKSIINSNVDGFAIGSIINMFEKEYNELLKRHEDGNSTN